VIIPYDNITRHQYLQFVEDFKAQHGRTRGAEDAWAQHIGRKPNTWVVWKHANWPDLVSKRNAPTGDDHPERNPTDAPADGDHAARNGHLPAIPTSAHSSAPERISALPAHPIASEVDDLKARVATLEAFMAALQERQRITAHSDAPAHPIAPERTEPPTWLNRGMHLAADLAEAIEAYAREHRLEKREVLDLALRTFFAQVGEEVRADA
jgi:hypothetical protein